MDNKDLKLLIAENSKAMSDAYLIEALQSAATNSGTMIMGDLRLDRMIKALGVVARHNCTEKVIELQLKINQLNQFRSMFSYKPNGFDELVNHLQDMFFFAVVDAGLGYKQLQCLGYLFSLNILETFKLEHLRGGA